MGAHSEPPAVRLATPAVPAPAAPAPVPMREVEERALDDPRAALAFGAQRVAESRATRDTKTEFWLLLGLASVQVQVDNLAQATREIAAAAALVPAGPEGQRERLWVDLYAALASTSPPDLPAFQHRQAERRNAARALNDETLLCRVATLDAVVYADQLAADEAWVALEGAESCGRQLGDASIQAYALGAMGLLASRVSGQQLPETYLDRAARVLGERPSRFQRAWLLDDVGWARLNRGELAQARTAFEQSLALSSELADASSQKRGHEGLAEVMLKQGQAAAALRHARESLRLAARDGLAFRRITAQTQVVEAMVALRAPELPAEIQSLREMAAQDASPRAGALIAASAARGLRALGQHEQAYAELDRYLELMRIDERIRRDNLAQHLQARYEVVRRDAEVNELRHRAEAARLELEARGERQRALWIAVLALLVALAGGGWFFARALQRRRRLADLALRDELTGLPNRRAVLAFAHEQFNLARRVSIPLAVAFIDLDRFKQVNDTYGHVCGDRVLQAFATAVASVLRGHDRVGRYGGEEWLVVMPGTQCDELAPMFDRLRVRLAEQPIEGLPHPHGVSFSMGGAQLGPGIDSLDALIAEADAQLYRAKASGRDAMFSASVAVQRDSVLQLAALST
ncbi:MAG TPA: GGDEF domain-containing protein [Rubrivivax sp.]